MPGEDARSCFASSLQKGALWPDKTDSTDNNQHSTLERIETSSRIHQEEPTRPSSQPLSPDPKFCRAGSEALATSRKVLSNPRFWNHSYVMLPIRPTRCQTRHESCPSVCWKARTRGAVRCGAGRRRRLASGARSVPSDPSSSGLGASDERVLAGNREGGGRAGGGKRTSATTDAVWCVHNGAIRCARNREGRLSYKRAGFIYIYIYIY
eukprot:1175908-Prorocentrum_minimum.AAC.3